MEATLKKSSSLLLFRGQGELETRARFSQDAGNLCGPKANFKIKTCWIGAQFLAQKPLNFASLTDSLANTVNINSFLELLRNRPPGVLYPPASFPVVLGDFGCDVTADVTCQACRENSPIALGSKPPLVTRIARTGLGTRLCIHHIYSLKLHREKERLLTT